MLTNRKKGPGHVDSSLFVLALSVSGFRFPSHPPLSNPSSYASANSQGSLISVVGSLPLSTLTTSAAASVWQPMWDSAEFAAVWQVTTTLGSVRIRVLLNNRPAPSNYFIFSNRLILPDMIRQRSSILSFRWRCACLTIFSISQSIGLNGWSEP